VIDVEALRADTPGVDHVAHFNNAGAALMPTQVIRAIYDHLDAEIRMGGYEARDAHEQQAEAAYGSLAAIVGARQSEIALMSSATTAWDMVVYSLKHRPGDRILTTTTEYGSNWAAYLQLRDRYGVEVVVVPDSDEGEIDLVALQSAIDERTSLISINHMPTNSGVVNPAAAVGKIARAAGAPYLLDACQTVGQMPIDVDAIGCDFLTSTSRKFLRGPRGVGFAYVRTDAGYLLDPVFADNHSTVVTDAQIEFRADARRLETWEKSWSNVMGLGAATDYAMAVGVDAIWERVQLLSSMMRQLLADVGGVELLDRGSVQGAIVSFTVDGREATEITDLLGQRSFNASYSTVNSAPIDMRLRGLDSLVRASVHAFNTEDEVERFVQAIREIAA
jgi:cysteine desulfurase/selenocysteine lyase